MYSVQTRDAVELQRVALHHCPSNVYFGLRLDDHGVAEHNLQLIDESLLNKGDEATYVSTTAV